MQGRAGECSKVGELFILHSRPSISLPASLVTTIQIRSWKLVFNMPLLLQFLIASSLAITVSCQTFNNETTGELQAKLRNLDLYWSYNRSPPVYPSRKF